VGRSLLHLPLWHSHQPIQPHRSRNIKDTKRPHEPKVTPAIIEKHIHILQKSITIGRATEAAAARAIIYQVPALLADVGLHVFAAGHSARCRELNEFAGRAGYWRAGEGCTEKTFYHVSEGVDAVHEDPEGGEFGGASKDTGQD
jgi:hypothetical protein